MKDNFQSDGFTRLRSIVDNHTTTSLIISIGELPKATSAPGIRHLLQRCEPVRRLAKDPTIMSIAAKYLGPQAKPVNAILFDKTTTANWYVTWHQDLTIGVKERIDVPGFGPWSIKGGVNHVQPPAFILENMLSIRIHLDNCANDNGALQFIPGSHNYGKLCSSDIMLWREKHIAISCPANRGDIIVMRPLILHYSAKASAPHHRRVLHIEYTAMDLPGGLIWSEAEEIKANQ